MRVVLFDMDGTLTPAREKLDSSLIYPLVRLQKAGFKIGIVSGSDIDYIQDQCSLLWELNQVDPYDIMFFPCNGTKQYISKESSFEAVYELDMRLLVGKKDYSSIIHRLLDSQIASRYGLGGSDIPLTGTFIQYRGSMINWCPIGRNATSEDRKAWVALDKKHNIRASLLSRLKSFPIFDNLEIKMGGETSFDIYPSGWDKSYVLNSFDEKDELWFVGDKCTGQGNDKELFDALQSRPNGESFETSGPKQTIRIIEKILGGKNEISTKE